jgi:hypothetical protein
MSEPRHVEVRVDMPGAFDSFFSGSGVAQGERYSEEGSLLTIGGRLLTEAYQAAGRVKRGRGYIVPLRLSGAAEVVRAALEVLIDYAETCVVIAGDTVEDRSADPQDRADARTEAAAARRTIERAKAAQAEVDAPEVQP